MKGKYYLELSGNERLLLMFALGTAHQCPRVIANIEEDPAEVMELANRIAQLPNTIVDVPLQPRGDVLIPRSPGGKR